MSTAFAHTGEIHPAAVPQVSLLTDWTLDPAILPLALVALLYWNGLRIYRRRGGRRFPAWRPWFFLVGVGVVGLALLSPIDVLADFSFTWHMAQHQFLVMLGPPLILLGAPFIPVVRGLPPRLRYGLFVPLARNPLVRAVAIHGSRPVPALLMLQAALFFWHYPGFYDWALRNEWVHYLEHFTFFATASLFWWNIVTPYPFPARLNHLFRMLLLFLSSIFNTGLSSMITFAGEVLYRYSRVDNFWSLSMLAEQNMGGALMWVVGAMMHMMAILAVFLVFAHREKKKEPPRLLYITPAP